MRDFVVTCREKDVLLKLVKNRMHLITDIDFYSLRDLVELAQGTFLDFVLGLAEAFIIHIKKCEVKTNSTTNQFQPQFDLLGSFVE